MTVTDVMTKQSTACQLDGNLAEVSALMWENDCGAIPVLAETGELAGIITDRDTCIALGTRNTRSSELRVRDVIRIRPFFCKTTDDLRSALQTMREAKARRLPVLDENGVLQGVVSIDSLIGGARRSDAKANAAAEQPAGHPAAA